MADNSIIVAAPGGIHSEGKIAASIVTPGELLEFGATVDEVQAHSTAAANAQRMFADAQEENAGADIDTDIAAADEVQVLFPRKNDKILAFLDNTSATISQGDALESVGNGNLRDLATDAATDDTQRDSVVAYAAEDVTSPGSGRVRITVYVA